MDSTEPCVVVKKLTFESTIADVTFGFNPTVGVEKLIFDNEVAFMDDNVTMDVVVCSDDTPVVVE